jgi:predicted esterase
VFGLIGFMKRLETPLRRTGGSFGLLRNGPAALALSLVCLCPTLAAEGAEPRWCAPETDTLAGEVCLYVPKRAKERPTVLVVFLHSLVGRGNSWQWEQQRTMVQAADRYGFAVLMPRGRLGLGPGRAPDVWAWPTAQRTEAEVESSLVAEWARARDAAEKSHGPFERTFVYGFSSGAYYAASLALRNPIDADGYALFAGGSGSRWKATNARSVEKRAPVFVAYGTKDPARRDPQAFAKLLKELAWPHRLDSARVGHTVTHEQLRRAFEYLSGHDAKNAATRSSASSR